MPVPFSPFSCEYKQYYTIHTDHINMPESSSVVHKNNVKGLNTKWAFCIFMQTSGEEKTTSEKSHSDLQESSSYGPLILRLDHCEDTGYTICPSFALAD